jgi:UDPglucose 6-dehydrogenase
MMVAVIGLGHVGLVLAACLAELGYSVIGVDFPSIVELVNNGTSPFFEPQLADMLSYHVRKQNLRATTRLEDAADARVIWITVGTTLLADGSFDIDNVRRVVSQLGNLCSRDVVLAIKSTMPVGACRIIAGTLPLDGPHLVYNPEFLREGSAIYDFFNPGKIVVGADCAYDFECLDAIYSSLDCTSVHTSWENAELIKLSQNALNALHISFFNELALATDGTDVSLHIVSQALRIDQAALSRYLQPGFSYGGSCLPANVRYLGYLAESGEYAAPLLHAIAAVNEHRIHHLVNWLSDVIGGLVGQHVALWGMAYKANTDDLRNSPSIWFAQQLLTAGAEVWAFDPFVEAHRMVEFGFKVCRTPEESLNYASALVVLTRCSVFASVPAATICNAVPRERIFDIVGALPQLGR